MGIDRHRKIDGCFCDSEEGKGIAWERKRETQERPAADGRALQEKRKATQYGGPFLRQGKLKARRYTSEEKVL